VALLICDTKYISCFPVHATYSVHRNIDRLYSFGGKGARWCSCLRHYTADRNVACSITGGVRPHYDSGFYSASNRTEYWGYLLVVKAAGA
jgi:hypothetical protein